MSTTVPPDTDLVTVTIDGVDVHVPKGSLLVEAAKAIHRDIPVYCYHKKLGPAGLCRVCLVEIEGMPKLQIACNTPVTDGMKVHTANGKVDEGRRAILEFLLLNHPLDCPICDKGGECDLQDFSMAYGQGASRLVDAKDAKPKAVDLGPTIVLDEERCILCLRCVRFDDIITREQSLRTDDRGAHAIIATATGTPYVSDFSGNVTELCPVGALTSKTYRFKSRPWDNHRTATTCTQCSVGCQMHVDQRGGTILRTMSVEEDDLISDGWLCDRGRYNVGYVSDQRRITQPLLRTGASWSQIGWDDAIALWAQALKQTIAASGAASVGAIGGGRLLNEEAFLLQHVHRALGVENLDWRAGRQQRAHPGEGGGTPADLETAQAIVTVGRTPDQLAPVLDLRIRKAVARNGARLIALGERSSAGSFVPALDAATVAEVRSALPLDVDRIAVVGDGAASEFAAGLDTLCADLRHAGKTVFRYALGEQANVRGAEAVGMRPGPDGLDTAAMFAAGRDGALGVLALLGVNPLLHFPDRALVEDALERIPFVVVSDLFMTDTAQRANLVLPACSAFEKSGTTTNGCGDVLPVQAAVAGPEGTLADGDMLVALADALGIALPAPADVGVRIAAAVATIPADVPDVRADAAPIPDGSLRLVTAASIFGGGGTVAHDGRLGELLPRPRALLHPVTAAALHVSAGDHLDLAAVEGTGTLNELAAAVSERIAPGTVAIVDGLPGAPANVLGSARVVRVTAVRPLRTPVAAVSAGA